MKSLEIRSVTDFYPNPELVREIATGLDYFTPEGFVGLRTQSYFLPWTKRRIERAFGIEIVDWSDGPATYREGNGAFWKSFSEGRQKEVVGIHTDGDEAEEDGETDDLREYGIIVYLTKDAQVDAGTSFWKHRETGIEWAPTTKDAHRWGMTKTELEEKLSSDGFDFDLWEEVFRVPNFYNSAVLFDHTHFHSATRHFGSSISNGRMYQTFDVLVRDPMHNL